MGSFGGEQALLSENEDKGIYSMSHRKHKLKVKEIKRAFAASAAFDGDVVRSPGYWESPEISDYFSKKHWQEVANEKLLDYRSSHPHFTDEAYRYFLPA